MPTSRPAGTLNYLKMGTIRYIRSDYIANKEHWSDIINYFILFDDLNCFIYACDTYYKDQIE